MAESLRSLTEYSSALTAVAKRVFEDASCIESVLFGSGPTPATSSTKDRVVGVVMNDLADTEDTLVNTIHILARTIGRLIPSTTSQGEPGPIMPLRIR